MQLDEVHKHNKGWLMMEFSLMVNSTRQCLSGIFLVISAPFSPLVKVLKNWQNYLIWQTKQHSTNNFPVL